MSRPLNIGNPTNIIWAYGVMTVPSRRTTYLISTLKSLAVGGFDKPWLFVDGDTGGYSFHQINTMDPNYGITYRYPMIRTAGNWYMAMTELYIRNPNANRFVLFQDDILVCRNLKKYLEYGESLKRMTYQEKSYYNLYTFPSNEMRCPDPRYRGWYPSNQLGKGAQALMFDRNAIQTLLSSRYFIDRFCDVHIGHKSVDGAICMSMTGAGFTEFVHNPSLVQHIGDETSMANLLKHKSVSFPGETFDACSLLPERIKTSSQRQTEAV